MNDRFLRACAGEKLDRPPVWLMRQAGRYMEDYRKVRAEFCFLDLCKRSDLAAEITVTTVEKPGVDAAIPFADILLILEPMGLGLEYSKDDGPVIRAQIRSRTDVEELNEALGALFKIRDDPRLTVEAFERRGIVGLGGRKHL